MLTFAGVCVFMFSPKLSRNVVFHYATGVGMGVGFSIVIATYMIQKKVLFSISYKLTRVKLT